MPFWAHGFLTSAKDKPFTCVATLNNAVQKILLMVVTNSMSARSATACAQLFRLMLKAQPQVEEEQVLLNRMWELQRQQGQTAQAAHAESAADEEPVPVTAKSRTAAAD